MKVATFIFFSFKHGMIEMVIIMKKILIVEDDESIADSLKEMLENRDYIVEVSYSKKETLEKLNEYIDLILLDIQLPDGNGISLCKEIKEKYEMPIIFLSCLNDEETIVRGLNEGGDDYVCKPFGIKELCARIECNLRKVTKQQGVYYIDDLIIDTLKHKVFKDNKELELSTIIFADEPTGNLDAKSSKEVVDLLKIAQRKYHETVILVTMIKKLPLLLIVLLRLKMEKLFKIQIIFKYVYLWFN